jgi:hypothetical protein
MKPSARTVLISLFGGLAGVLFVAAGLVFWFGGALIHALGTTDRVLAEVEGLSIALLLLGLAGVAKIVEDRLDEGDERWTSKSLGEALRK